MTDLRELLAAPMRRVALYARVSTSHQDLDVQLVELRTFASSRGWTATEFTDDGISGAKDRRPALDRLMAAVRAGEVDAVVVVRLDRLGRSLRHLLHLADELRERGVDLVATAQSIDTSSAGGRLVFGVLASMAEFERELIRERVTAGVRKARASGMRLGRPRRWSREQGERATRLRADGVSLRRIAMSIGLPVGTVRRALAALANSERAEIPARGEAPQER